MHFLGYKNCLLLEEKLHLIIMEGLLSFVKRASHFSGRITASSRVLQKEDGGNSFSHRLFTVAMARVRSGSVDSPCRKKGGTTQTSNEMRGDKFCRESLFSTSFLLPSRTSPALSFAAHCVPDAEDPKLTERATAFHAERSRFSPREASPGKAVAALSELEPWRAAAGQLDKIELGNPSIHGYAKLFENDLPLQ